MLGLLYHNAAVKSMNFLRHPGKTEKEGIEKNGAV